MKRNSSNFYLPSNQTSLPKIHFASPGLSKNISKTFGKSPSVLSFERDWKISKPGSLLTKQVSLNCALKSRKPDLIRNLRRSIKNPYAYSPVMSNLPVGLLEQKYSKLASKLCY